MHPLGGRNHDEPAKHLPCLYDKLRNKIFTGVSSHHQNTHSTFWNQTFHNYEYIKHFFLVKILFFNI